MTSSERFRILRIVALVNIGIGVATVNVLAWLESPLAGATAAIGTGLGIMLFFMPWDDDDLR